MSRISIERLHAYCSWCGHAFTAGAAWPRVCGHCGETTFLNPIPVVIVLLPVASGQGIGVVAVRRAIEPHAGMPALPGGYVDFGESWQAAGVREMAEEAGIRLEPASLRPVEVFSAADNTLIVAAVAPARAEELLPPFTPNRESSARLIVRSPVRMAFALHTELVTRYLAGEPLGHCVRSTDAG